MIPKIRENSKNGIVTQKIQCHDNVSKISPATVGPNAGPANITKPMSPIALPRLFGGKMVKITFCVKGKLMANPAA